MPMCFCVFFCFLMRRRPPRSTRTDTLFPYTTLFRSLRNTAPPDSAIHEDFTKFSSDAERALWVMANWPDLFATAEAIYAVSLRIGKRGWKRLQVPPVDALFRGQEDIRALEVALATTFTPRKGTPRA